MILIIYFDLNNFNKDDILQSIIDFCLNILAINDRILILINIFKFIKIF